MVDGLEDDAAWKNVDVATNFYMVLPMDTSSAKLRTDVRMTYDDNNIYIVASCFNGLPGAHMVESLRRDWDFSKNDNFIFFMDPFDDQTNGFSFGANAAGGQWDGIMYEGGTIDLSWDNKWISEVKQYPDRYVFEAAIPFKSIRYKKGITQWGINFSRNDLKSTEKSSWAPVPRQFPTASLAYTGFLEWDQPPPTPGANISVIPYVLGAASNNPVNGSTDYRRSIGGDAKEALTSSLNLDLTVNPDFSQVEVDRQVTNLSRFELFFPEKRQFFLENGDLFANFGYPNIRPFFSRRIGLGGVPIRYGARLSGRINRKWRIGVMDMQTGPVDDIALPAQNFVTAVIQRRIFARSNIGILFMNKESLDYQPSTDPAVPVYSSYNRNVGMEYNLASSDNRWTGKALYLKSFSPGKEGDDFVQAGNLKYFSRKWLLFMQEEYTGKNYTAEAGFVPRHGYIKLDPQITRVFFPKGSSVLSHGPSVVSTHFYNTAFQETDNESTFTYLITFRQRSTLSAVGIHDYVKLLAPFDPTNSHKDTLAVGTQHNWNIAGLDFVSKPQSVFTYAFSFRSGGYYADGKYFNFAFELRYRFQPYVSVQLNSSYNQLDLPQPWGLTKFWLISPRLDVTMTNKLFMAAFLQYNQQVNNTSLQARLQWRYRPASDLFLVFTENATVNNTVTKGSTFTIKWTYWWNL